MTTLSDFKRSLEVSIYGNTKPEHCVECKLPFSHANVHTPLGWKETKLSKLCEDCFDNLFSGDSQ